MIFCVCSTNGQNVILEKEVFPQHKRFLCPCWWAVSLFWIDGLKLMENVRANQCNCLEFHSPQLLFKPLYIQTFGLIGLTGLHSILEAVAPPTECMPNILWAGLHQLTPIHFEGSLQHGAL